MTEPITRIAPAPAVYLTRAELADHLRTSTKTIARWQKQGLPTERWTSRLVRYRLDRVEAWLQRRAA